MPQPMTASHSTSDLVLRAQEGDRAAFDELFRERADRIEYYVRMRLGMHLRRGVDVQDVVQEVALRGFRALERFTWRGEGSLFAWLRTIAEHVVLEAASRQRRDRQVPLVGDVTGSAPSQAHILRREERFERLQRAFDSLPAPQRQVILLARLEKLPLKEVAVRMDRSPAAVKQLLWRALKQLRASFGDTESLHLPDRSMWEGDSANEL